jgi:UDP-N-acetyl-D-mannosaminuronic acid dehydrogenase
MKNICVMGLGYIGLPTASMFASQGFEVLGVDVDQRIIDTINQGKLHIEEPGLHTLFQAAVNSGKLTAALEPREADVFILAVPTPIREDKTSDMSHVEAATRQCIPHLRKGSLVLLESTSPPGTCRDLIIPLLEEGGLVLGRDVYLAHCPERVLPGKILRELISNDRVIGGYDPASSGMARDIYSSFVEGEIYLTDLTTAEMVKIAENTFRDVNIALANELSILCEKLNINFWEMAELANKHPRVNIHSAGPGVGGHCISVDPWFLVEKFPAESEMIHMARRRNDSMPEHVVKRLSKLLNGIDRPKVAVLGLAFKGDVDDLRGSPSLDVVRLLEKTDFEVAVQDPHVKYTTIELKTLEGCVQDADCIVILTNHSDYQFLNPRLVAGKMRHPILFDARNCVNHEDWLEAGFQVEIIGRG